MWFSKFACILVVIFMVCILLEDKVDGVALELPEDNYFHVLWQMPHGLCKKHEMVKKKKVYDFEFPLDDFDIINNPRRRYNGEYISIFYHFGEFPMYAWGKEKDKKNGGIPQLGDMKRHLLNATADIKETIPNPDFRGVGIINQEDWKPNWDENFSWKDIYQKKSKEWAKTECPKAKKRSCSKDEVEEYAIEQFEKYAMLFTVKSVELLKLMRPGGKYGYYAYPYCYNYAVPTLPTCKKSAIILNTKQTWFWKNLTAITPSIYFFKEYSPEDRGNFLYSQTAEGIRTAELGAYPDGHPKDVYMYVKMKYNMTLPTPVYRKQDMWGSIRMALDFGCTGIILWGSDPEFNRPDYCGDMKKYAVNVIGPYVKKSVKFAKDCARKRCNGNGRCVHEGALDIKKKDDKGGIMRKRMSDLLNFKTDWNNLKRFQCRCFRGYKKPYCTK